LTQVTGVNTIDSMIEKITSQSANTETLEKEKYAAEQKLKEAKRKLQEHEEDYIKIRTGNATGNEEKTSEEFKKGKGKEGLFNELESLDTECLAKRQEMKLNAANFDRLTNVLLEIFEGTAGLYDKTKPFLEDENFRDPIEALALEESAGRPMTASSPQGSDDSHKTTSSSTANFEIIEGKAKHEEKINHLTSLSQRSLHHLGYVETICIGMIDAMGEKDSSQRLGDQNSMEDESSMLPDSTKSELSGDISNKSKIDIEDILENKTNNRRIIYTKKQMNQGEEIEAAEADDSDKDQDEDNRIQDGMRFEDFVPYRSFVKEQSNKEYSKVKKEIEAEAKRVAYEEKLKQASDKEKNLLQSKAMRKKEQEEHASKMSTVPGIIGLPKGLTLKDSPMRKAKVFLDSKPPLR